MRIVSAFKLTHYAFIFAYFLMLSSHPYYTCEVILKLAMLKILLVHRQNVSFSMCVHALNGDPHVIITFLRGERFEASLLFSLV